MKTSGLRSAEWYSGDDRNSYIHRAWMRRGLPDDFHRRPQIAIANTASDLTPCNSHLTEVAQSVKNGIYEAGGTPLELPVVSLGETQARPTAMLWRNMAAMATEEMLRANPIDAVVLLGGCDKTIPALLMAAASVDIPAIVVPGGPMLSGHFRGEALGCGTDVWRLSEEVRAGTLSEQLFLRSESSMIRSRGHCNTMGTASTMALLAEALGTVLPGLAGTPASDSRLLQSAQETGRLAVQLVSEDRRPSTFLTSASFHNAIVALAAIGGSTNAVVHLLAIAGRLGIDLSVDDFDRIGADVPCWSTFNPPARTSWTIFTGPAASLRYCAKCGICSIRPRSRSPANRSSTTWTTRRYGMQMSSSHERSRCCPPRASPCSGEASPRAARSSNLQQPHPTC